MSNDPTDPIEQAWVDALAQSMTEEIDREIVASFDEIPRLANGDHVLVLETRRVVTVMHYVGDKMPGRPMTWYYQVADVLTGEQRELPDCELGNPLCEMEVLAWASKIKS
jgi:hypothetical protein